jgi:hypothetical protein
MTASNKRISIEREFALWRRGPQRPLSREGTQRFMQLLRRAKNRIPGLSEVDGEVAHNAAELKFSLINTEGAAELLSSARSAVQELGEREGLTPIWSNQPEHTYEGHNEFFTTLAFPELIRTFVNTNSTHIHFEIEPEMAFHAYRQLNALAPWFMVDACDIEETVRMMEITQERTAVFGELFLPQELHTMEDYEQFILQESATVHRRLGRIGRLETAREQFPAMFREGRVRLSDDKVFSQARVRPALELPNGNISVEFRPMNGIKNADYEAFILNVAIWVFEEALGEGEISSMRSVVEFCSHQSTNSPAYRRAEEFVQEVVRSRTGRYAGGYRGAA